MLLLGRSLVDCYTELRLLYAVHRIQGKYGEAEPLYERCQAIQEKVLGPEHPHLATTLHSRAGLLEIQVGHEEVLTRVVTAVKYSIHVEGSTIRWGWWRAR